METQDKRQFANMMVKTAIGMDYELKQEKIAFYWDILKEYPVDNINRAFNIAVRNLKWFPKPSELIEIIEYGGLLAHMDDEMIKIKRGSAMAAKRLEGWIKKQLPHDELKKIEANK